MYLFRASVRASDKVVAQICTLAVSQVHKLLRIRVFWHRADYKSAIQQIPNLRYIAGTYVDLLWSLGSA